MRRRWPTVVVWTATLLCLAMSGAMLAGMLLIPVSLDPTEMVGAGLEPWSDALTASGSFAALVTIGLSGLGLWHTNRFRPLGLALVLAEIGATGWAVGWYAREYF